MRAKLGEYVSTIACYARETQSLPDFVQLMRVRLSQSRLGPLVCRRPTSMEIDLAHLGSRVRLRTHTTDIAVLGEVLVGGSYEPLAAAAAGPVATIVDLGANTGLAARWLLER